MTRIAAVGDDRVRTYLSWTGGHLLHGKPSETLLADAELRLSRERGASRISSGVLTVRVYEELRVVEGFDGQKHAVQTFRYKHFDGGLRWMTVCVACGDVANVDESDLSVFAVLGCRKCGMGLSTPHLGQPCDERHTFGSCLHCPGADPSVLAPFAGAQSGPAQQAGPITTGDRSAVERKR